MSELEKAARQALKCLDWMADSDAPAPDVSFSKCAADLRRALQSSTDVEQQPAQQEPVEVKQIAEALRQVGLTLVRSNGKFCVMDLGRIEAQTTSTPASKPLTDEQIDLFINGRGDEGDDDYVEPTGDGFGLTDADLVRLVRRVEAAHGIKGDA